MSFERTAILALLVGFALFGFLRTRFAVGRTFAVPQGPRFLGVASVVAVLVLLFFASRTAAGAVAGGLVLGLALFAAYRLRRSG